MNLMHFDLTASEVWAEMGAFCFLSAHSALLAVPEKHKGGR
jgi:hypothetical protein